MYPMRSGSSRARDGVLCAALTGLAIALRALPAPRVLGGANVDFFGNDAWYHARRILWSAWNFPALLDRDPYINFPHGGQPIWPPLFDGAGALLMWLLGPPGDATAERVLVWIPPLLGGAAVAWGFWIARRHFGTAVAGATALLLALLPAHFHATQLGYLDHHAAVALLTTGLLGAGMGLLSRWSEHGPELRRDAPGAVACGLLQALALGTWPGTILYLGLLAAGLFGWLVALRRPAQARAAGWLLALTYAVALVVLWPVLPDRDWERWGAWSPLVLSHFQPALLASFALVAGVFALARGRARSPLRPAGNLLWIVLPAAALLVGGLVAAPDLGDAAREAWSWFARTEVFQAEVAESRPLLVLRAGRLDASFALQYLSGLLLLAPVALLAGLWLARREAPAAPRLLLLGWCTVLLLAAFEQARFMSDLAFPFALLLAWTGCRGADALCARGAPQALARGALFVVGLLALLPCASFYAPAVRAWSLVARPDFDAALLLQPRRRQLREVAEWLRENTPATAGFFEADARPRWGVLSHWADGHLIEYVARRPTVVDNFGDDIGERNFELAAEYYLAAEPRASEILDELRARYVIFEERPVPGRRRFDPHAMLARALFADGSEAEHSFEADGGRPGRVAVPVEALERHRLVLEAGSLGKGEKERPAFKLYEHVTGARLVGAAPPGALVKASLELRSARGRSFAWRTSARADADGRFAIRVPYATRGAPPGVAPEGPGVATEFREHQGFC